MEDLERRLRALEDREAIRELIARYAYEVDCGEPPDWASVFSDDIEMEAGKLGTSRGLAEIERRFTRAEHLDAIREGSQHAYSNVVVDLEVDGDHATAWGYACVHTRRGGEWRIYTLGVNRWRLRREGGAWRFVERQRREVGEGDWRRLIGDRRKLADASG
jgi:hypothetical protein